MNILFEEDGSFKAGTVLSQTDTSYQAELATGRRVKVKANAVLLQFKEPAAASLLPQAEALAQEMDAGFLWECAPQEEFNFQALGAEYFGHAPNAVEAAALLLKLHGAPVYFHRKGKGHYRPAPPDILQAALAALERRQREAEQQAEWTQQLVTGTVPPEIAAATDALLFKPDKNSKTFKALEAAAQQSHQSPAKLLLKVGALRSAHDYHTRKFLFACFPRGTQFPALPEAPAPEDLPRAAAPAFSIDDESTTEIDDAFSVQWLDQDTEKGGAEKTIRIGIHIAAPGLSIRPGDAIDQVARQRLSTVYMPGDKITMLPDDTIAQFTLSAGRACPALSLYVEIGADDLAIRSTETRIERVEIAANLRHNDLDAVVTEAALQGEANGFPYARELRLLWQFAKTLTQQREQVRGKPERHARTDYNFSIQDGRVDIVPRQRGAPLDTIVSELMILANSTWGALLAQHNVPGMYRVQTLMKQGFARILSTRMTTKPGPHMGLGVAQYAWSTSPLRRYADLVNQWQILACVQGSTTPFKHGDADLFALVSNFDATYSSYAEFQQQMENYWCLQWLKQNAVKTAHAHVVREEILRLADIPLIVRLPGLAVHPRGTEVIVDLLELDEMELVVHARCKEVLTAVAVSVDEEEEGEEEEEEEEGEEEAMNMPELTTEPPEESPAESIKLAEPEPPLAP
ncbi:MAG: RNB domain-containing ribonuclease [Burkholderiaceae bacterium]|nr:MAG: RNB domain-containing ribonuclease [Burkholderiaceae bacterium]